jgi:hypothetical protein
MRETTLGGNQWRNETQPMTWNTKATVKLTQAEINAKIRPYDQGDDIVEFLPMEIKTFVLFYN